MKTHNISIEKLDGLKKEVRERIRIKHYRVMRTIYVREDLWTPFKKYCIENEYQQNEVIEILLDKLLK